MTASPSQPDSDDFASRPPPRGFRPEPFDYHQVIRLRIETLTNQGTGLGRIDGWVVMVPFSLPGELISARVFRNHKNFSEADLLEVITPAEDRRSPRCPLFGRCGGCQYQHLNYPSQLEWKRRQVAELLQHLAKVEHPVDPVVASPREFGYRSKLTPHHPKPRDGKIEAIGFLRSDSRSRLTDVPECPIAMPAINDQLAETRARLLNQPSPRKRGATLLLRADASGRVTTDHSEVVEERVGDLTLKFQAGDFFQNNPYILPTFTEHVISEASAGGARHLVDSYCGSGLFALAAADRFTSVTGIEISESSIEWARRNASDNSIPNARFLAASAEAVFQGLECPPEDTAIIMDPPRRGSDDQFLDQLIAFNPVTVVYVSCNPATQMRDLTRLLAAGYTLERVQPFDLFPQTKHLECVIRMRRPSR